LVGCLIPSEAGLCHLEQKIIPGRWVQLEWESRVEVTQKDDPKNKEHVTTEVRFSERNTWTASQVFLRDESGTH
jgi:hypothetical protein